MNELKTQPLLLQSISGADINRPPVWLMRQAGRYMKEYRDLKAIHGFLGLCRSPELITEVTLQPIDFLDPDAAIIFSDIMIPAEVLGFSVDFKPGPVVANPFKSKSDLKRIKSTISFKEVDYVLKGMTSLRKELEKRAKNSNELRKALIGFCGSPWTIACYLIEQIPYKGFQGTKVFAAKEKETMHSFLSILCDLLGDYLIAQVEAGADAVQIFDSWGGLLSKEQYNEFGSPYLSRMIQKVKSSTKAPVILYTNGGSHLLREIHQNGADVVSLDWRNNLSEIEKIDFLNSTCIQGNLDPSALFQSKEEVIKETKMMLSQLDRKTRFIANLGHGILQKTPPENVKAFVDTIKKGW